MISDIEIQNFQGHVDTSFSLGPRLNVVKGVSNSGKSNIIRLLIWVLENRPRGDNFRNRDMGKRGLVTGSIAFTDGGWVIREKGKDVNQYLIPTSKDPLKALRTDMPAEVRKITMMKDLNIQSQHPFDQYFMLTKSPGQVAKELNNIIGLSIIDTVTLTINKTVKKTKSEIEFQDQEIKKKETGIKELDWVKSASEEIDHLIKLDNAILSKIDYANDLENLIAEYKDIEDGLKKFTSLDSAILGIVELKTIVKSNETKAQMADSLKTVINMIKTVDINLSSTELLKKAKTQFLTLKNVNNALENKIEDKQLLENLLFKIKCNSKTMFKLEQNYKKLKKERDSYSGELCPICGGVIK